MNEKIFQIYYDRAKLFFERLPEYLWEETIPLQVEYCNSANCIVPWRERERGDFKIIAEGEVWGKPWDSAWFHCTGAIPTSWRDKEVSLWFDFGSEALIFDEQGTPYYALSVSSIFDAHFKKEFFPFVNPAGGDEKIDLWIEGAANQLFGMYMNMSPASDEPFPHGNITPVMKRARMGIFNSEAWHLRLDFEVLLGLCETLSDDAMQKKRIVAALSDAINAFADNAANAAAARGELKKVMLPAAPGSMQVTAVGHAHIDIGWLWRVRESVRKCARTFANQLYNLEQYPSYVFGASQAQLYAFVKEHYPSLYEKVKAAIKAGRWELQGGMWVECDCNLTSGESMVRQFLHGKNFFRDEFGIEVKNVWLPDVFGYSAAMPQICRQAGCDFFLTQKISWNQINRFPNNTFIWEGIDGTTLLTHYPPEDTYLTELNPAQLIPAQNRYSENVVSNEFISLFGIGNGGGGPKQEYIERGLRLADLSGSPQVRFGKAQTAFERMKKLEPKLSRWVGELYLELHRGTYTTQAKVKKGNRELEQLLTATEIYLSGRQQKQNKIESQSLDRAWKKLLINQFHDILPGSSIPEVYQDTLAEYEEIRSTCRDLLGGASNNDDMAIFCNTLAIPWRGLVEIADWQGCESISGCNIIAQSIFGNMLEIYLEIPLLAVAVLQKSKASGITKSCVASELVLENELIRYEFSANGEVLRCFDKELQQDLLRSGQKGNVMSIYIDRPNLHEAWDHDIYYHEGFLENARETTPAITQKSEAVNRLIFDLKISNSTITLTVELRPDSKMLCFTQEIDWQEKRRLLRVAFEADVNAKDAFCDIQYGYVKRPTHQNTSWEQAKFEVPIHRYAALCDERQGFALLNDCKYGVALAPDKLDLMLLRAPKYPDWEADIGSHKYRYAFMPIVAEKSIMTIIDQAALFNRTPLWLAAAEQWEAPCLIESDNIRIEVIKKAEKSDDLIIRVIESAGKYSLGKLQVLSGYSLHDSDLLEWESYPAALPLEQDAFALQMRPFEIRTFRLKKINISM